MNQELLTVGDVAKLALVSPGAVRLWAEAGRLAVIRTAGGLRLFERGEVERLVADRSARARQRTGDAA